MTALSVFAPRRFARLLVSDAMNVSRDPMLIFACVLSALPAIGLSLGSAGIDAAGSMLGVVQLHQYLIPMALLLPAFLIGWVSGFLLLEDRDDGPLLAVQVTPIGRGGFLAYRLSVSALITAAITAGALALLLPEADNRLRLILLIAVPADTVLAAVALLAIARNKVEGLALTKLTNIAAVVPLLASAPSPLRLLAGVIPTYWVGELLAGSTAVPAWAALLGLAATHAGAVAVLVGLLNRRSG